MAKEKLCEHRHEITFSFTVIGFGDTEEEAIQEARNYAIGSWTRENSTESYDVVKVEKDRHSDICSNCLEEE